MIFNYDVFLDSSWGQEWMGESDKIKGLVNLRNSPPFLSPAAGDVCSRSTVKKCPG